MPKDPMLRQIIKIAIYITIFIAVIFAIAAYWYYSLLVGWIIGSVLALIAFSFKIRIMRNFFNKNTNRRMAFFKSLINTYGYFLLFGGAILSLLAVNYAAQGKVLFVDWIKSISAVSSPINLFTFIAGMHVIMFAIFISHIITNRKKKKEVKSVNI